MLEPEQITFPVITTALETILSIIGAGLPGMTHELAALIRDKRKCMLAEAMARLNGCDSPECLEVAKLFQKQIEAISK
jgi:hypothetical protein